MQKIEHINFKTPRSYGLGRLSLVIDTLTGPIHDIRHRVRGCTADFQIGVLDIIDHVPSAIAEKIRTVAVELRKLEPNPGHQSILFGRGGQGSKGIKTARRLAAQIVDIYRRILEYDTAMSVHQDDISLVEETTPSGISQSHLLHTELIAVARASAQEATNHATIL